ncbi:MAG TPA: alpha/beta hydrolase [Micromonosporaceae bacterium]|jgi:pimeloyl-ACP methyl ester carboxylesterase
MPTRTVHANGIAQAVTEWGSPDGAPVLLIHGNCSSGAFWEPFVRRLIPVSKVHVVAPDLRGYGHSQPAPVDATRGLRDFADDVAELLDLVFGAGARPVVAGHSMGGGVAMQLLIDHPQRVAALLLESPVSPYGFGGTRDVAGNPTTEDFAGTGAGTANPAFVGRLAAKDRGSDGDPTSPRQVMRTTYVADPEAFGGDEEAMLETVLSTVVGEENYPGDATTVSGWPGMGPGTRGVLNAMSPKYFRVADELLALPTKPPVVWVHGSADAIVGDATLFDFAQLGKLGIVPGWPGQQQCPPQPMVSQTRSVFERYAAAGGSFREVLLDGCGHSPHIERPAEFLDALLTLLR